MSIINYCWRVRARSCVDNKGHILINREWIQQKKFNRTTRTTATALVHANKLIPLRSPRSSYLFDMAAYVWIQKQSINRSYTYTYLFTIFSLLKIKDYTFFEFERERERERKFFVLYKIINYLFPVFIFIFRTLTLFSVLYTVIVLFSLSLSLYVYIYILFTYYLFIYTSSFSIDF